MGSVLSVIFASVLSIAFIGIGIGIGIYVLILIIKALRNYIKNNS